MYNILWYNATNASFSTHFYKQSIIILQKHGLVVEKFETLVINTKFVYLDIIDKTTYLLIV